MTTRPAPTNARELLSYLAEHPDVVTTCDRRRIPTGPRRFHHQGNGGLWFETPNGVREYVPIDCGQVAAETGLEFRPDGFDVTKFGVTIRFDYAPAPAQASSSPSED